MKSKHHEENAHKIDEDNLQPPPNFTITVISSKTLVLITDVICIYLPLAPNTATHTSQADMMMMMMMSTFTAHDSFNLNAQYSE